MGVHMSAQQHSTAVNSPGNRVFSYGTPLAPASGPILMEQTIGTNKLAPVKMVNFIAGLLIDLPSRSKVLSVEVDAETYRVTVASANGGVSLHHLSAWDVSRSMRGDPTALATLRADLGRHAMAV